MPYIEEVRREAINWDMFDAASPGELNYQITRVIDWYIGQNPNYSAINDVIGALECAKLELYRRVAAPYEDKKCAENGDVYLERT